MKNLRVSGLNLDISWKNREKNFEKISSEFAVVETDLFILPEMFSTGFCMDAEEIADRNKETLLWMKDFSKKRNTAVCGSVSVSENGKFFNRFYFVEPDGKYHQYDKRHLFSYSGEDRIYSKGNERVIVEFEGWRILLQVCYDLRFPVFSRSEDDYDAIIYVANWPETRVDAWTSLLKARAIENQCYVFGLNRIGTDGNGLRYAESSCCFFADGTKVSEKENNIITAEFNVQRLTNFREKFRFLDDRDKFHLIME
ncbi:amidohydrolase [Chryseobacterium sp.]|uniref:amidohydrolase n=1 Tax=Chryseobacterium sp. TaxID=1871047 RepID=UPI0011C7AAC3|nr:amidohydrolase [Chryseobacterium sp.]TXF75912.1 amidohydrolase [Chryseobacterium sp.]